MKINTGALGRLLGICFIIVGLIWGVGFNDYGRGAFDLCLGILNLMVFKKERA